jgi:hypothetical protein
LTPSYVFPITLVKNFDLLNKTTKVRVECTCVALSVLHKKEAEKKNLWNLIEAKALKYLECVMEMSVEDWKRVIDVIEVV